MKAFLEAGELAWETARQILDWVRSNPGSLESGVVLPLSDVKLAAPVPNPAKIVAVGLNYMDHCREQKVEVPKSPILFAKFPSSVIGPGDPICWSPELTSQVDYEGELGVIIGRPARDVPAERAYEVVAGYTIVNDISARDLQFGDGQWVRGKSLDTFCPMGPWLVTKDEIEDPQNLEIRTWVNDQLLQDSNTREMIFKIPELIEFMTRAFTLYPGDVISTGTPDGVGVSRNPQVLLKKGDQVKVAVQGLGELSNYAG
jgi:2-keto-4-pentenoate hydratase/2-oxohepta-3-ene-1,7-dioic acid hydratase in catechol pathway